MSIESHQAGGESRAEAQARGQGKADAQDQGQADTHAPAQAHAQDQARARSRPHAHPKAPGRFRGRSRSRGGPRPGEGLRPPLAGGAVPLLGHAWPLVRDPLGFLAGLRDHGDLVRLRLGPRTAYAVCAPELVGRLLRSPEYEVGGPLWDTMEVLLGKGVATSNGALHRRQRRMMQPAFRPERIADYAAVMEEEARAMVARWEPGATIDVGAEMFRASVRIVSRSLLEVDSIAQKAEHISTALGTVFAGLYRRMVLSAGPLYRLPTPANRRFARALGDLHGLVDEILAERHASAARPPDLITALLEATDESGAPLGDQEIHDHLVSLVVAGAENVSATLAWTLSLLTEHPAHGDRLAEEVNAVTGGRPVSFADIGALPFTRNVITEAMRIRPAPWILTRRTVAETELGGYTVPARADIVYSTYAMQRDPRSFRRHLEFDPDRWLPERAGERDAAAMIPFGTGNRKCPGDHFSMAEFAIVLATVVPRWRFSEVGGTDTSSRIGITLHPKRLLLRADRRGCVPEGRG